MREIVGRQRAAIPGCRSLNSFASSYCAESFPRSRDAESFSRLVVRAPGRPEQRKLLTERAGGHAAPGAPGRARAGVGARAAATRGLAFRRKRVQRAAAAAASWRRDKGSPASASGDVWWSEARGENSASFRGGCAHCVLGDAGWEQGQCRVGRGERAADLRCEPQEGAGSRLRRRVTRSA